MFLRFTMVKKGAPPKSLGNLALPNWVVFLIMQFIFSIQHITNRKGMVQGALDTYGTTLYFHQ